MNQFDNDVHRIIFSEVVTICGYAEPYINNLPYMSYILSGDDNCLISIMNNTSCLCILGCNRCSKQNTQT
jgi:hypothetical protein